MRYLHALLMVLMTCFMVVQFNDPDGFLWVVIYAVPSIWCAIAFFYRTCLQQSVFRLSLRACVSAALVGVVWFWPRTPEFWVTTVWYETETAREGMGMIIVAAVLLTVLLSTRKQARSPDYY